MSMGTYLGLGARRFFLGLLVLLVETSGYSQRSDDWWIQFVPTDPQQAGIEDSGYTLPLTYADLTELLNGQSSKIAEPVKKEFEATEDFEARLSTYRKKISALKRARYDLTLPNRYVRIDPYDMDQKKFVIRLDGLARFERSEPIEVQHVNPHGTTRILDRQRRYDRVLKIMHGNEGITQFDFPVPVEEAKAIRALEEQRKPYLKILNSQLSFQTWGYRSNQYFDQDDSKEIGIEVDIVAGTKVLLCCGEKEYVLLERAAEPEVRESSGVRPSNTSFVGNSSSAGAETCFVATAAYGSPWEEHVVTLRCFRQRVLLSNEPGRWFVRWYYLHSPAWAAAVSKSEARKYIARIMLTPCVLVAGAFLGHGYDQCLLLVVAIAVGWSPLGLRRHGTKVRLRSKTEERSQSVTGIFPPLTP